MSGLQCTLDLAVLGSSFAVAGVVLKCSVRKVQQRDAQVGVEVIEPLVWHVSLSLSISRPSLDHSLDLCHRGQGRGQYKSTPPMRPAAVEHTDTQRCCGARARIVVVVVVVVCVAVVCCSLLLSRLWFGWAIERDSRNKSIHLGLRCGCARGVLLLRLRVHSTC